MLTVAELKELLKEFKDYTPILIYSKTPRPGKIKKFLKKILKIEDKRQTNTFSFQCSVRFDKDHKSPFNVICEISRLQGNPLGFYLDSSDFPQIFRSYKNQLSFIKVKEDLISNVLKSISSDKKLTKLGKRIKMKSFLKENKTLIKVLNYCVELEKTKEYKDLVEYAKKRDSEVFCLRENYF